MTRRFAQVWRAWEKACFQTYPATIARMVAYLLAIAFLAAAAGRTRAVTWTTLDFPGATSTELYDIDHGRIVGVYEDALGGRHGLIYDGVTWTTLDYPGATETTLAGIDAGKIIGTYYEQGSSDSRGFIYDGISWTTLQYPGAELTLPHGIDSGNTVGSYRDSMGKYHGFLYDGRTWTTLDYPGYDYTELQGIDGNNIVGRVNVGFLYDGMSWTPLDFPAIPSAIDGRNIAGLTLWAIDYIEGGIFDGSKWTGLNYPGWEGHGYAFPQAIDGDEIVGFYYSPDRPWGSHGFLTTIPEPSAVMMLAVVAAAGAVGLRGRMFFSAKGRSTQ
jgi:hypothetical protein